MSNEEKEMISITKEEYDELLENSAWLLALEDAGVDNWSGFDYAGELYREQKKDQK
jgi:hypothetical protein